MKSLVRPTENSHTLTVTLTAAAPRRPAWRTALGNTVLLQTLMKEYSRYEATSPAFNKLFSSAAISDKEKRALRRLYAAVRTTLHAKIIGIQPIDSIGRACCQLCGIGTPDTLDHYLDKASYPEFSVLLANLVPACHTCNSPRRTFDEHGDRRILHLFEGDVPCVPQLLKADVYLQPQPSGSPVAVAAYSVDSGDPTPAAELYRRHWSVLKLKKRYEEQAPVELKRIRTVVSGQGSAWTLTALSAHLNQQAQQDESIRGLNDWRVALYRAAALSQSFMQQCGAQ